MKHSERVETVRTTLEIINMSIETKDGKPSAMPFKLQGRPATLTDIAEYIAAQNWPSDK